MALKEQLTSLIPLIAQDVKGKGSSSVLIQGNGRPDKPETTRFIVTSQDGIVKYENRIKGNEPNGTFYSSLDGANVGAYLWQKQKNQWNVVSADTGERDMSRHSVNIKSGNISLRRINNTVECTFSGGQWDAIYFYGTADSHFKRKSHAKRMDILPNSKIPFGFRASKSIMLPFYDDEGVHVGMVYVGGIRNYNYIELRFKDKPPAEDMNIIRMPIISWITNDPFPETLP